MPASWWSAAGRGKPSRSTTVVANTESGSHCLKVDGFSRSKNLRPGECLQSSTFPAGGHRWRMYCQPNSDGTEGTEGFVSVYLVLDEDVTKPVRAEYKFTVAVKNRLPFFLSKKPPEVPSLTPRVNTSDFDSHGAWGFAKFLKWEDLEKAGYLKYDSLIIKCSITIINEFRPVQVTSATPPPPISVPPSDLCHHLAVLLDTALGSDVVFNVGGETMPAHQDVLAARSPVFCTEFFGVTMERTANRIIQIDDIEANVFSTLLYFIYTDSLPEMKKGEEKIMLQHLLVAAERYKMERLKLLCQEKLCKHIDGRTVVTMLVLADQQG